MCLGKLLQVFWEHDEIMDEDRQVGRPENTCWSSRPWKEAGRSFYPFHGKALGGFQDGRGISWLMFH